MIFDLAQDFHEAMEAMPEEHDKRQFLEYMQEAVATYSHVLLEYPEILFQTCYNVLHWQRDLLPVSFTLLANEVNRREEAGQTWLRGLSPAGDAAVALIVAQFSLPDRWFHFACWSGKDGQVLLGCRNGDLLLWAPSNGIHETLPNVHRNHVCPVKGRDMYRAAPFADSCEPWVAVASWDRRVHVVDMNTRKPRLTVKAHAARVTGIVVLEDGLRFASCGWDRSVALFCATTGRELARWTLDTKPTSLAAGHGTRLYVGTEDGGVFEIDYRGSHVRPVRKEPGYVVALAHDAKRDLLFCGGEDQKRQGYATVLKASDGDVLWNHSQDTFVSAAAIHSSGDLVAFASAGGTVAVLDLSTHELRYARRVHGGSIRSVEFSPDGTQLLTAGHDGSARVLSVERIGSDLPTRAHGIAVMALAVNASGTKAVSVAHQSPGRILSIPAIQHEFDLDLAFWSLRGQEPGIHCHREVNFRWAADPIEGGSWLNDTHFEAGVPLENLRQRGLRGQAAMGQELAVYNTDVGAVLLVPADPDKPVHALVARPGTVRHVLVSPKGDLVVLACFANDEGVLLLSEIPTVAATPVETHDSVPLHEDLAHDTATSMQWIDPDTPTLAVCGSNGTISCFNVSAHSITPVDCPTKCCDRLRIEILPDDRTAAIWRDVEIIGFFASDQPLHTVATCQCSQTLSFGDREGHVWHMTPEGT